MKKIALLLLCFGFNACGLEEGPGKSADRLTPSSAAGAQALPGSYIVAFRSQLPGDALRFSSYFAEYRSHYSPLAERHLSDPRIKDIRFLTSVDLSPEAEGQTLSFDIPKSLQMAWNQNNHQPIVGSLSQVEFVDDDAAKEVLEQWNQEGRIWFAEPNYLSKLSQAPEENYFGKLATSYGSLNNWWLSSIRLAEAYQAIAARHASDPSAPTDEQMLTNRPIIAILDSGVDFEHPALKDRIWTNKDINASGCLDDIHGCNTTVAKRGKLGNGDVWPFATTGPGQPCPDDDNNCAHGTHVAGLIVGNHAWDRDTYQRSVAGVCPVCQVMVLKIVGQAGSQSGILDSSIIAALKYVALFKRQGSPAVRVINASFGKFVRSRAVGLLVRLMKDKNGALVAAAAGNEDTLTMEYPAAFSDAIAVAAVDSHLRKVTFSNFGTWVDISAPGSQLLSTVPGGAVDSKSGTSMAAPLVSGVAGLMLARYPDISFDELRKWLLESADPSFYSESQADGFNYNYYYPSLRGESERRPLLGLGLLNASSALQKIPTQNLPLNKPSNRVQPGCGIVAGQNFTLSRAIPVTLLILPAAFGLLTRLRRRCRRIDN